MRDPDTGSVVSITEAGAKRYLLHDAQDSTLALLSPGQEIKHKYAYDPDGKGTTVSTGSGPTSHIQWNGAVNIHDSGIYHFGARLYDPAVGRWTQPDPINQPAEGVTCT